VSIVTSQPERRFVISGIGRLGSASLGGASFLVFSLPEARELFGKSGQVDQIYVAAAPHVTAAKLVGEISSILPPALVARATSGAVATDAQRLAARLSILKRGLLAFALVAVFVGAFVIFNTFSITVTQRSREFALLRALGATRGQILSTVLGEAAGVGLAASVAGLAGGLLAAALIRALFKAVGYDLPSSSLQFEPRTALIGLGVGLAVTVAAGVIPALRAMRAAPLEALRDTLVADAPDPTRSTLWAMFAGAMALAGLALIFTSTGTTSQRLATSVGGSITMLVAIAILTPRAVGGFARVLAWPLERGDDLIGRLARENTVRNPARTAITASSLMIGLALVLFVTVYANGLRASSNQIINRTLVGDYTIENIDGTGLIPAASARAAAFIPQVSAISSLKTAAAFLGRAGSVSATGIDPTTFGAVYHFDWVNGNPGTLANLGVGDVLVERETALRAHVDIGSSVVVRTETGARVTLKVTGIYDDTALLPGFALARDEFDQIFNQPRLQAVLVKLLPGANLAAAAAALNTALAPFPGVVARSRGQLRAEVSGRVNNILVLFYGLLAMCVVMTLLGLINTLTLSIHERTRELGLLRAIGMTPEQASDLIRGESLITAAMGSLIGVVLGVFFAWVITRALVNSGVSFAIPWLQVVVLVALGLLAGVVASIPPARQAAGLDVLAAVASE
jgi:putative ABC transport system permease protein